MSYIITGDLLDQFRTQLTEEERSPATIEKYLRDVGKFCAWAGIGAAIDKETVLAYKDSLAQRCKIATANAALAALNHFFKALGWTDCVVRPFKLQRESFRDQRRELSREEYHRLTEAAQSRGQTWLYLIIVTLCATGLRVSELPFVTVESLATRQAVVRNKGKTRRVILPVALCRKLRAYARERGISRGSVFVTRTGKPLDRSNIHHAMKKLCARAGVEPTKVFPHNLRHLFAVEHYERHHDLAGLASLLGHANVNTTRIYIMVTLERKEEEINALGLVV